MSQTNFLMLLALTGFWRHQDRWRGGISLAFAIVVKPLSAFFLLQPLLRRSWHVLGGAAATLVVISIATVVGFGWKTSLWYFISNISARMPRDVYIEDNRQSLLAMILRAEEWNEVTALANPVLQPGYLALAAALVLTSAWLVVRLGSRHRDLGFALLVPCGLLVYPATLSDYGVLLILPILYLWSNREGEMPGHGMIILLIVAVYALTRFQHGFLAAYAYLILWGALAGLAFWHLRRLRMAAPAHVGAQLRGAG